MKQILLFAFAALISMQLFAQATEATLLGVWHDPSIPGTSAYNNAYNEVWGVVVDGVEYGIIGSTQGTHFIDVSTDPSNPTLVAFVPGKAQGLNLIHRDFHDHEGFLYAVADEGPSSLQIMDYSTLPDSVTVVYDSDDLIVRSHNIFIDEATCKMYSCGTALGGGGYAGVAVYDISTPTAPSLLGSYSTIDGVSGIYVHDIYVKNDTAYMNCGSGTGLVVVDFAPSSPVILGTMDSYAQQGYNHSGWLADDGQTYYMADETHGTQVKVVDASDFTDLQVTGFFDEESGRSNSIVHNLVVSCNYLYASYYYDGVQVYDISDPAAPVRVAYYDTYSGADINSYEGAWGVYPFMPSGNILVSDMQSGLHVIQGVTNSCNPSFTQIESCNTTVINTNQAPSIEVSLFPQPASTDLTLTWSGAAQAQLDLFDLTGRMIQSYGTRTSGEQIDVTALTPGVYMIRITQGDETALHKVLID